MVEAPAVRTPWLRAVSVTAKLMPGLAAAGGLVTAVSTRSGRPTTIVAAVARQLLVSFASATTAVSSAQATRWYVPSRAVVGIVTVTVPADCVAGVRAGTDRVPVSSMSAASFAPSIDR